MSKLIWALLMTVVIPRDTALALVCYSRILQGSASVNGSETACHNSSTCYSYVHLSGTSVYHYAGCGACSISSDPTCVQCSTNYCNTLTPSSISCYTRTASTSDNGIQTLCPTGTATCYGYTSGNINYAGCGNCSLHSSACNSSSSMCSTGNFCNTKPFASNCYYSAGNYLYSDRRKISCGSDTTSCYEFSYGYDKTNFFFAGCGTCSAYSAYPNCRICDTDYCNSATTAAVRVGLQKSVVAAAVAAVLVEMKLF